MRACVRVCVCVCISLVWDREWPLYTQSRGWQRCHAAGLTTCCLALVGRRIRRELSRPDSGWTRPDRVVGCEIEGLVCEMWRWAGLVVRPTDRQTDLWLSMTECLHHDCAEQKFRLHAAAAITNVWRTCDLVAVLLAKNYVIVYRVKSQQVEGDLHFHTTYTFTGHLGILVERYRRLSCDTSLWNAATIFLSFSRFGVFSLHLGTKSRIQALRQICLCRSA